MARSSYIYLVYDGESLAGAFTVKHEMYSWIANQKFTSSPRILRLHDGTYQKKGDSITLEFDGTWNSWSGH